ncbi:flagellar export chaperone FliS [Sinanaerobacter sp. ZZT-01]|uniref:flagellar export chaperone FliS n=1 Tax=Sinanaerobacter sp. ZZT-01 TaxID=3111540 RepID=UPI002D76FD8A|nr:flagellar export chaperone FliS [Sinanaerobacter sp. ZZT-01]WRR93561.1 flagellar export chaperone FliS [Sinanaerobacter sp. ZZT-01]
MNQYMNNYGKGFQHYKEQSVNTMTKSEMLFLLYDEIIKKMNKAKILANNKDYANFKVEIDKTRKIVLYLMNTLDLKYAVSKDLSRMYEFFNYELSRLSASRNLKIIDELIPLVIDLKDTFKEADRLSRKQKVVAK